MIAWYSRSTRYFKLRLLYWKNIFLFRLSFATFGPGSKTPYQKLQSLANLADDIILCTVDVVGWYPNILHDNGLSAPRKCLDLRKEKAVTTSKPVEIAEVALKVGLSASKKNCVICFIESPYKKMIKKMLFISSWKFFSFPRYLSFYHDFLVM